MRLISSVFLGISPRKVLFTASKAEDFTAEDVGDAELQLGFVLQSTASERYLPKPFPTR